MRAPDTKTAFGQAWELPIKEVPSACVGHWLINVPGAHPFWEHWHVLVISLKDIPGVPPAKKRYPEAEFEFLIASINPEACPLPDPSEQHFPLLDPVDVVEQFHGVSERDALRVGQGAIQAIMNGRMSPDQDFRAMWHRLITDTTRHLKEGRHPEN
jgi:hypothetical protein